MTSGWGQYGPPSTGEGPRERVLESVFVDFDDTPEEAAFRAEAQAFLEAHASLKTGGDADWSRGAVATDPVVQAEYLRRTREWQATLYDNGWAGIAWPKAFGGRAARRATRSSSTRRRGASTSPPASSVPPRRWSARRSCATATPEQQARYLGPLLRGDELWCQLFSEPGAGSDLAALVDPGGARRRRVGRQRPEGVDVRGAPRRLRHPHRPHRSRRAQAPRHHVLRRRHAHAGHRHPAARAGDRACRTSTRCS